MPVTPASHRYDLVVQGPDGAQLFLRELIKTLSWEESLDEAAVRLKAELRAESDVAATLRGARAMFLTGVPFGKADPGELWRGIPWDVRHSDGTAQAVSLTAYDPLIYPTKTEDDFYYEAGSTATYMIRDSAAKWGVPIGTLAETSMALKRQVHRGASLWKLWQDICHETAKKGGGLYRPRFRSGLLEMVPLGSNPVVWLLEIGANIKDASFNWTREGETTRAKVVGQAVKDVGPRPVLAVYEDAGLVAADGVIQKILSDPLVKTAGEAEVLARQSVRGPEEGITVEAPDINTLRAGDAVVVRDRSGASYTLLTDHVEHDGSKGPGTMKLTLATAQQITWRWCMK